ncbi:MAG: CDP-glucose 4,6-dehydratase [Planctomycetes bacterium]|nr:CDP-glucose 4,6-dehydratase [Planctomycetota bacterium]
MFDTFNGYYRGKRVMVTGHTGFKGSWLAIWLHHLGAKVTGYSLEPPTAPSVFVVSNLARHVLDIRADVRDFDCLDRAIREHRPEIIFHLAAQPLVRTSFSEPRFTFDVNLLGTVNVLDAALRCEGVRSVVAITSDKCYLNVGREHGYSETDTLGGHDPYSASKACAELAIQVYQNERFQRVSAGRDLAIASARAGNVIGGGDWARDRIVPDLIRAMEAGRDLEIRNPDSTRPWQHVLEPLSGYLWLGALLDGDRRLRTSWNFGPDEGRAYTVLDLVSKLIRRFRPPDTQLVINRDVTGAEARLLQLDCSKAHHELRWRPTYDLDQTLDAIVEWFVAAATPDEDMFELTREQIERYTARARDKGIPWAAPTECQP